MEKICVVCKESKDITEFKVHKGYASGRAPRCKKCISSIELDKAHAKNPSMKYKCEISRTSEEKKETKKAYQSEYYLQNKKYFSEYKKEYRTKNKEVMVQKRKNYYKKNQEEIIKKSREYREANPDKIIAHQIEVRPRRRARWVERYGISSDEYIAMVCAQDNKCAICGKPPKEGRVLCVDHDHNTGKVRGLLCIPCNCAIGALSDSVELLMSAVVYLQNSEAS